MGVRCPLRPSSSTSLPSLPYFVSNYALVSPFSLALSLPFFSASFDDFLFLFSMFSSLSLSFSVFSSLPLDRARSGGGRPRMGLASLHFHVPGWAGVVPCQFVLFVLICVIVGPFLSFPSLSVARLRCASRLARVLYCDMRCQYQ
ncbi:hypothetical protein K438DRAFT_447319 [Mycena galopus ATCC 62051]|nr:hypothetical protein K438DRAFT_447319 [Mycena galopus ATCC 62051]